MFKFDEKFITKIVSKDHQAFHTFYLETTDSFYRYVKHHYKVRQEEIEDMLSDFYVKFWKHVSTFDGRSSFENYVWMIFKSVVADYFKKEKEVEFSHLSSVSDEGEVWSFEDQLASSDEHTLELLEKDFTMDSISWALDSLRAEYREVLLLKYVEEYSYEEIATSLGTSEANIRKRVSRWLASLKQHLKNR